MVNIELLKAIPFFDPFSEDHLKFISSIAELASFRTDEVILEERQINLSLYFLVEGAVDIFVEKDYVATYSNNGEVIGEMSIVNHAPSSATVFAREPSSFVRVSFEDLKKQVPLEMRDALLKNFYMSCSEILAKKLKSTNLMLKAYYKARES